VSNTFKITYRRYAMLVKTIRKRKKKTTKEKKLVPQGAELEIRSLSGRGVLIEVEPINGESLQIVLNHHDMWRLMAEWLGPLPAVNHDLRKTLEWVDNLGKGDKPISWHKNELRKLGKQLAASHAAVGMANALLRDVQAEVGSSVDTQEAAIEMIQDRRTELLNILKGVEPQLPRPTKSVKKKVPKARTAKKKAPAFEEPKAQLMWPYLGSAISKQKARRAAGKSSNNAVVTDEEFFAVGRAGLRESKMAQTDVARLDRAVRENYADYLEAWKES
jgi:hypothetical protein